MNRKKEAKVVQRIMRSRPPNSKKAYWAGLRKFFEVNEIEDPDEYIVDVRKMDRNQRIDKLDQYEDDIRKFAEEINSEYAPKTQQNYLSTIRKFFMRNRIDLPQVIWDDINRDNHLRGARSIFEHRIPTAEDLRKLMLYTDVKGKALFTLSATTGTRINELLKLKFDNLFLDERKIRILRADTKSRYQRVAFFTEEAHELLVEWLKQRPQYLLLKYRKSLYVRKFLEQQGYRILKNEEGFYEIHRNGNKLDEDEIVDMDNRVFPFSYGVAKDLWYRMLESTGPPYNEKDSHPDSKATPRYKYHIHCLKRFFLSQMERTIMHKGTNEDMQCIYAIVGHRSRLGETYTPKTMDKVKEVYEKYADALAIFRDTEAKKLKPRIEKLNAQLVSVTKDNLRMEERMIEMSSVVDMLRSFWFKSLSEKDKKKYSQNELLISYLFGDKPRANP